MISSDRAVVRYLSIGTLSVMQIVNCHRNFKVIKSNINKKKLNKRIRERLSSTTVAVKTIIKGCKLNCR